MNCFSGSNLALAPHRLIIPVKCIRGATVQQSPQQVKESQINSFLHAFRSRRSSVGRKEASAYLEMCDWVLDEAIQDAKDDFGWEDGDSYSDTKPLL